MKLHQRLHSRCACAGAPFTLSGTTRKYEVSRPFVIRHLSLKLQVNLETASVAGEATLTFQRVSPLDDDFILDAVGFDLEAVRLAPQDPDDRDPGEAEPFEDVDYEYDGERLSLQLPRQLRGGKLCVRYRATPRRGLYFLAPDDKVKNRPVQVWSQCQDEDARYWFPCQDKPHVKMTTELRAEVPHGFVALSNGQLVEKRTPKAKQDPWVYHFLMDRPHPSYLVTLVVGRFSVIEETAQLEDPKLEIPLYYYVPEGQEKQGQRAFGGTPKMVELFSKLTGVRYPWNGYSQVVVSDFIFGGMENTTATTMYEHILLDERAAIDVTSHDLVAHELAHQWFGDYVTCRDWSHAWLNEGFATFFEHIEREARLGQDEYDYGITGDIESYLSESGGRYQRAIVCRDYEEPIDLFDRHLYEKGGLILHMLRRELGDEIFWNGVRLYLERHAHGVVETRDLERALEEVSGRSLERFFDQWVYRPGHPVLRVKISWEKGKLTAHVKQTQKTGDVAVFAYPFELAVADDQGNVSYYQKNVDQVSDALVVELEKRPAWVAFDPRFRIASRVHLEVPADLLQNQLKHGTHARLRWNAARALGKRDDLPSLRALGEALLDENETWMVRVEAAVALGRTGSDLAFDSLSRAVQTPHPKVRRGVATALGEFRREDAAQLLEQLTLNDSSYLVVSAAARALGKTRQPGAHETLMKVIDTPSWADVVRAGCVQGLSRLRDEAALDAVIARSRYGIPNRGRRSAIAALPLLSESRRVREHLEDMLRDKDPHVRMDVVSALETLGDVRSRAALHKRLEHELDGRVVRRIRECLRNLTQSPTEEQRRLRDEVEGLRKEFTALKLKFAELSDAIPEGKSDADKPTRDKQTRDKQQAQRQNAPKAKAKKRPRSSKPITTKPGQKQAQTARRSGATAKPGPSRKKPGATRKVGTKTPSKSPSKTSRRAAKPGRRR